MNKIIIKTIKMREIYTYAFLFLNIQIILIRQNIEEKLGNIEFFYKLKNTNLIFLITNKKIHNFKMKSFLWIF